MRRNTIFRDSFRIYFTLYSKPVRVIPLPTTLPDAALSLEREHEIGDAL